MATYALTVSTNALGLGVIDGATVRIEKRRVAIADTYPPINNLIQISKATDSSGIATFLLEPDDLTTYHVAKIFDLAGVFIYEKSFTMPPSSLNLHDSSISTDTVTINVTSALELKVNNSAIGAPSGVAPLDENGNIPGQYLSFVQTGTGAVARTTQAKLREFVSVKDFGAVGDGVTDDTAAFLAAIANSRTIYVPDGGTYIVSGILSLNDNTAFVGIGSPTIKKKNNDTNAHCIFFISSKKNVSFSALTLDGNGANQTASASSNKAVVEVWNDSANIQFNSVVIQNGYKWNMYLKGNSDAGAPSGVVLTNSSTKGALGFVGGIAAADGNTGIACIGADLKAVNCNFFDRVDLEPNTSAQTVDANFSNCKFFMMLDSGISGLYGSLTVSGCTFYAQPNLPCVQIYGGTINGNVFEGVKQGVVLATEWYGIIVLGNNNRGTMIVGNKINNATIGIGFAGPIESSIVGNAVVCNAVDNNAVVYNGFTLPKGGIVSVANSAYRDFICNSNRVRITEDFHSAGGFGINFMSNDSRGSSFVGNAVLRTGQQKGKMQASVSRYYASIVSGNAADVYTGVTGGNLISSFTPSKTELEPRNAPPTTGNWIIGDYTPSNNPAGLGSLGWVCTLAGTDTNATWTKVGLLGATKAGQVNDSVATDTAQLNAKINELLARLRAAGLLVP